MFTMLKLQSRNAVMSTSDLLDEDMGGTYGTLWPSGKEGERVKEREMVCLRVSVKLNNPQDIRQ